MAQNEWVLLIKTEFIYIIIGQICCPGTTVGWVASMASEGAEERSEIGRDILMPRPRNKNLVGI